jgi:uncharacterized membrane protein
MMDRLLFALAFVAAIGCGLNGGVFFAFSAFVMKALARLAPAHGIAAMQSINVVAVTPVFMTALFGTGAVCVVAAVAALLRWGDGRAVWLLVGGLLYVGGTIAVTIRCNVPRNNALAAMAADSAEGERLWARYVREWTAWNHVRTAACLAAAASFTIALWR